MAKSKAGESGNRCKSPKKVRVIVQIMIIGHNGEAQLVGKQCTFRARPGTDWHPCINRYLLQNLLSGTTYTSDNRFDANIVLSFGAAGVGMNTGSGHPLTIQYIAYGKTSDLYIEQPGKGLFLRLHAKAG